MAAEKRLGGGFDDEAAKRLRADVHTSEVRVPQQYVGWLKGTRGGQIKQIEDRSGASVNIDQSTKDQGYSRAVLSGSYSQVQSAISIINGELARVMDRDGFSESSPAISMGETVEEVQIPQKYVGWLKGSGGSQIVDMETKSGARVRIDQSTRESGFSIAQISGTLEAAQKCRSLIEAELNRVQERDRTVEEHAALHGLTQTGPPEIRIPQQYVGWIKGAGGSQIKDIEQRSGAHVTIDQSTQELGYSRALLYGSDEAVGNATRLLQGEISRIAEKDGPNAPDTTDTGDPLSAVATLLAGVATAVSKSAAGGSTNKTQEIANILSKAASSLTTAVQTPRAPPSEPSELGPYETVYIPNNTVGWLKGRQGAMIREIESRSGAQVDIDQTDRDSGYSLARIRGGQDAQRTAYGLIVSEIVKVADNADDLGSCAHLGTKEEFKIDVHYVGWVKGPRGKVVQDIQVKSGTRIDVDQNSKDMGFAMVKIYGTHEGTREARTLIAAELAKVSPDVAAEIAGDFGTVSPLYDNSAPSAPASGGSSDVSSALATILGAALGNLGGGAGSAFADASPATSTLSKAPTPGPCKTVQVPNACVGWLKGRQGAMIREIESRSGAQVDIDQTCKELGYSLANIRGTPEQQEVGYGLVVAEVMKVADNSREQIDTSPVGGTKEQIQLDPQYVGWVKGPKGKVVQDIQVRTGTRIDVDQSASLGYAVVKIYGTTEGVPQAKLLIADELRKVAPDVAAAISGDYSQVQSTPLSIPTVSQSISTSSFQHVGSASETLAAAGSAWLQAQQSVAFGHTPSLDAYGQAAYDHQGAFAETDAFGAGPPQPTQPQPAINASSATAALQLIAQLLQQQRST